MKKHKIVWELAHAQDRLAATRAALSQLEEQRDTELADAQRQIRELNATISQDRRADTVAAINEGLLKEIRDLKRGLGDKQALLQQSRANADSLLKRLQQTRANTDSLLKRVKELEAMLAKMKKATTLGYGTFGWVLAALDDGKLLYRLGWNGEGQHIALQVPDINSKMTKPYIYIQTVQGDAVPWLASQTDLLATDWRVVA